MRRSKVTRICTTNGESRKAVTSSLQSTPVVLNLSITNSLTANLRSLWANDRPSLLRRCSCKYNIMRIFLFYIYKSNSIQTQNDSLDFVSWFLSHRQYPFSVLGMIKISCKPRMIPTIPWGATSTFPRETLNGLDYSNGATLTGLNHSTLELIPEYWTTFSYGSIYRQIIINLWYIYIYINIINPIYLISPCTANRAVHRLSISKTKGKECWLRKRWICGGLDCSIRFLN